MNSILYQDSALNSFRLSRISRIEAEVPFTGLGIKYVGSGREVYFANDRKYRVEAGSYLIGNDFTRSIVHINQPEPVRGICIDISSQIIAEVVSSPVDRQSDITGFLLSDQLLVNQYRTKNTGLGQCLEKIWRQLEAESHLQPAGEWLQEDLFYTLAEHIVSDQCLVFKHLHKLKFRKSGTKGEIMRSLLLAREYMDDQLAENPSLDEIAQVSGISKYHFIRLFREVFAVSPYQYLQGRRLELAKQELLKGKSVTEVAIGLGYFDSAAFSNAFKSKFGVPPQQAMAGKTP